MVVDTTINEQVIIEGTSQDGARFGMLVILKYDPNRNTVEEALIKTFRSNASNFEELAVENGWNNAYWTYPMSVGAVI